MAVAKTGGDNPFATVDEKKSNEGRGLREWTSGDFKVEAEFVRFDGAKIVLKRKDGKELNVPINLLSPADQKIDRSVFSKNIATLAFTSWSRTSISSRNRCRTTICSLSAMRNAAHVRAASGRMTIKAIRISGRRFMLWYCIDSWSFRESSPAP